MPALRFKQRALGLAALPVAATLLFIAVLLTSGHGRHKTALDATALAAALFPRPPSSGGYIVFAAVTEQLGKAVIHMEDVFALCIRYNRTCVLPSFGNGEVLLEGAVEFDELFDLESLPRGLSWVSWREFVADIGQRPVQALLCSLGKERLAPAVMARLQRTLQFHAFGIMFLQDEQCQLETVQTWPVNRTVQVSNLQRLDGVLKASTHDVLALFHLDWSEPLEPTLRQHGYRGLEFNAALYQASAQIRARHGPYLHLQWRTEKPDISGINFTHCAVSAVQYVRALQQLSNITAVYFSSDVGRDGMPWSNSLSHANLPAVRQMMDFMFDALPDLLTWVDIPVPRGRVYDLVIVGLLERLVAIGADRFVTAPLECSRGGTYVAAIANWRAREMENATHGTFGAAIQNAQESWTLLPT